MANNTKENTINENMNIVDLDFSLRTFNCLQRAGIMTIADLKKFNKNDLKKIRNLGKNSYEEIIYKMRELNIELNGCVYCSQEDHKDYSHATSLETENYRICNEINVTISVVDKKTNEAIDIKNIKDNAYIKYCPFCGKKL